MPKLDALESRLQALFEDHLMRLLPGQKTEAHLARQLATAMQANLKKDAGGAPLAPDIYILAANPATLTDWRQDAALPEKLLEAIQSVAKETGLTFARPPKITTTADTSLPDGEIRLLTSFGEDNPEEETDGLAAAPPAEASAEAVPGNAFLILHGTKIIPLTQAVINIGRRLDNHIVIDDPRVSRNHAQLRAVKGRFVLFDLNSTGGTLVNGQPINQTILYPGDVISLAGVTLIFGQDLPAASHARRQPDTQPGTPASADRPTAVLKTDPDNPAQ
ncbi:MAG: FHA domain-containing protein [Anaerolineales bacterium]